MARHEASIARLSMGAYTVPTATPESDGTLEWHATTLVLVEVTAADVTGVGFSYADMATARLVHDLLRDVVVGRTPLAVADCWGAMVRAIRNLGRPGIASMAIAAVDNALWDLKARLLDVSLVTLLGAARLAVPVYGSGGFTSYSLAELEAQLKGWTGQRHCNGQDEGGARAGGGRGARAGRTQTRSATRRSSSTRTARTAASRRCGLPSASPRLV